MRKPRAGAAVSCLLVALIALGASGCSGEPEKATASPAATSSAEPAPEAGTVPDAGGAPDPGAVPSDDATPDPGAVPSDDPLPGAEVAPAAPVLPVAAMVPDAAGAQAFMQHYWELVNHAYATGDGSVLTPVSHPECGSCRSIPENIATAVDAGGAWKDFAFLPEQLDTVADQIINVPTMPDVMITTGLLVCPPGATVVFSNGTVDDVNCREVETVQFVSQWMGDHWSARGMEFPERSE